MKPPKNYLSIPDAELFDGCLSDPTLGGTFGIADSMSRECTKMRAGRAGKEA